MKRIQKHYLLGLALSFGFMVSNLMAQTPSDAIMMRQKEFCIVGAYDHSWFDHYWEGTYLRTNGTIATVKRDVYTAGLAIGIFDQLNIIASAPYVKTYSTDPNGGHFIGAKGIQDLNLALKWQIIKNQVGPGKLYLLTTAGFGTRLTNYLSDYRPYSIGNGTTEYSLRGIVQYKFDNGLYARGSGAYLLRGQTKAERDYYYNNGSYYTPWMDVPSAWTYNGVVGILLLDNYLKVEANYVGQRSTSGDDIRAYNAAQPTNKVNFDQVGASVQYYFKKFVPGLSLFANYSQVVNGRNLGKSSQYGFGITYQSGIFQYAAEENNGSTGK